jgi:hypothetical protein
MSKEERVFISHEEGDHDAWKCICGNIPCNDGFYPCDYVGKQVEPVEGEWEGNLYVCASCGRIINCVSLEVVSQRREEVKMEEEIDELLETMKMKSYLAINQIPEKRNEQIVKWLMVEVAEYAKTKKVNVNYSIN